MNIIVVSNSRIPSERANSLATVNTAQGFAELGHNVELLIPDRDENKTTSLTKIQDYYGFLPYFDIRLIKCTSWPRLPKKIWFQIVSWTFARNVKRYIKKNKPDLVYSRSQYVSYLCGGIFEAHQYSFTKKWMVRKCGIVSITNVIRKKYGKGIVAHLGYRKHPATNIVKSEVLVLGNPKKKIRGATVVNGVKPKDVYNYLEGADVLWLPSTGEYNCPLKLIEYLSTDKLVVVPKQPNVDEICIVKPMTWKQRSKKILTLIKNDIRHNNQGI